METNKIAKKVLGSVLIGGLLLSLGGIAMAGTTEDALNSASKTIKAGFFKSQGMRGPGVKAPAAMQANLKTKLGTLVTAGTITQTKADAIIAAFVKKQEVRKTNPLSELVTAGVITQAECDAIAKIMPQRGPDGRNQKGRGMVRGFVDSAKMQALLKANLAKLVTAATITQAQSDKIVATCAQEQATRAAEFVKIKAMTKIERQQYIQANQGKAKPVNPLNKLVTDGSLTQAQADAIFKTMPKKGPGPNGKNGKGFKGGRYQKSATTNTN